MFIIDLDFMKDEYWVMDYLVINLFGKVFVLIMDDGMVIIESVVICRFVEEFYFEFFLFGIDVKLWVLMEMWVR